VIVCKFHKTNGSRFQEFTVFIDGPFTKIGKLNADYFLRFIVLTFSGTINKRTDNRDEAGQSFFRLNNLIPIKK
jgi:hypothetical protein